MFCKYGKFYLLTSGTTGYFPNPSEIAAADLIHGPWKVLGNPCLEDSYNDSFNCQFSSVFKVPGKELYIALGDWWMEGTTLEVAATGKTNTALATYVWLPIKFKDDIPVIEWIDEWSLAHYTDEVQVDPMEEMKKHMGEPLPHS